MEDKGIDLGTYWRILQRRWWVLVLGVVAAAMVGYYLTSSVTPVYHATVKVLVQGRQTPGVPSASEIEASQQLAKNYGDLIATRPIMERVANELSLDPGSVNITVTSPRSLIEIRASNQDPEMAALIANTTARVFIDDFRSRQFVQIARFQASLEQYGIIQDPAIIAAQASLLSTLAIVEEALPPGSPVSPRRSLKIVFAMLLGLMAAGVLVFVLEYLDDSIKTMDELATVTGMPNLSAGMPIVGSVPRHPTKNGRGPVMLDPEQESSALVESYKFLQTNLEFAALGTPGLRSLLVTSSAPEEGKTTTAANLAISIAGEGKSVILVDADLRKPTQHRIFDLKQEAGLTHLLLGNVTFEEALTQTSVDGLKVMPSGALPPDATRVLRSARMKEVVELLKNNADLVIFDSPPLLSVTDPMLVAPLVDGVLLVVDAHRTGRKTVKLGAETLQQAKLGIMGTVVNKVSSRKGGSYYYYYYFYDYSEDGKGQRRDPLGRLSKPESTEGHRWTA